VTEYSTPPPPDRQPGWRTDPWFTGQYRWWDGSVWAGDVFPEGVGPYGRGTVVTERPPGERPLVPPPWQPAFPAPPPPSWVIGRLEQAPPPPLPVETIESVPARRLNATAILALLLVFGIALGTTIGLLTAHHSKSVAATPPPATPTNPPTTPINPPAAPSPSITPSPAVPAVPTTGLLQRFSLRQSDLPSSQQLSLIPDGDTVNEPTLDLCNGRYGSESRRVSRLQLSAQTADGSSVISSEAVLYDSAAGTTQAFTELQQVAKNCPSTPVDSPVGEPTVTTRFAPRPDASWPTVAGVQRLAYTIVTTDVSGQASTSTVIYLRRGKALLGLYLPKPDPGGPSPSVQGKTSATDITAIFEQRLASLPASAIGA
jgi:hypothetical protein